MRPAASSAAEHAVTTESVEAVSLGILAQLRRLTPAAAAQWIGAANLGAQRQLVMTTIAQRWADQDSLAMLRWAVELPDQEEYRAALATGCAFHAAKDGALAVKLGSEALLDDGVMSGLMQQWAGQDAASARTWLEAQPAGSQRDQMMSRLVTVLARHEPAAAAEMVAQRMVAGPLQDEAALAVLHQWARQDRPAARHWVDGFPAGPARQSAEAVLQNAPRP